MQGEINIGIPKLTANATGGWQRRWLISFERSVNFPVLIVTAKKLTDSSIEVFADRFGSVQASITLCSGEGVSYEDFWANGFRIMFLLDGIAGLIEKIEGRPRKHWSRFFFQADHERTLDRYKTR